MKKILLVLLSAALLCGALPGCSGGKAAPSSSAPSESAPASREPAASENAPAASSEPPVSPAEKTSIRIGALKGPTAMGMVKLMEDAEAGDTANEYSFTISAAIDEVTPKIVQGAYDIAAVPANLASVLYNSTDGAVQVLAVNTLGVLYIVETGDSVQSVADLKGKTIYASGKGATPEYALDYLLSANGIDPEKDVTIEYKSEHSECVAAIAQTENGIALLPQPFVTTAQAKNENIRIALDLTEEWEKVQEDAEEKSALITGVVVIRKEFADQNPEAVAAFLDEYKSSTDYVNANAEEAAALIEKQDIVPAAVAKKALPYCNITCIEGAEMQSMLGGYLGVLMEQNPKAVGGALPDDAFYYSR